MSELKMDYNSSLLFAASYLATSPTNQPNVSSNAKFAQAEISAISKIRISIYAVCLFLGIAGNLVVVVTSLRQNKITCCHVLLAHLSVTDLIFCLRLPFQIQLELNGYQWQYGAIACKIFQYINSTAMLASIGTMTVIAVERYRGITKVVLLQLTKAKTYFSIVLVWLISMLAYCPIIYVRNIKDNRCKETWRYKHLQQAFSVVTLFLKYLLPLAIIAYCYWKIARVIRSRPILAFEWNNRKDSQQLRRERSDNRTVRMLIVMVAAFAVLTLPASIWWILYDFQGFESTEAPMEIIEAFAGLVYFHSCVNPFVYLLMDSKFRASVKNLFSFSVSRRIFRRNYKVDLRKKAKKNALSLAVISLKEI